MSSGAFGFIGSLTGTIQYDGIAAVAAEFLRHPVVGAVFFLPSMDVMRFSNTKSHKPSSPLPPAEPVACRDPSLGILGLSCNLVFLNTDFDGSLLKSVRYLNRFLN